MVQAEKQYLYTVFFDRTYSWWWPVIVGESLIVSCFAPRLEVGKGYV